MKNTLLVLLLIASLAGNIALLATRGSRDPVPTAAPARTVSEPEPATATPPKPVPPPPTSGAATTPTLSSEIGRLLKSSNLSASARFTILTTVLDQEIGAERQRLLPRTAKHTWQLSRAQPIVDAATRARLEALELNKEDRLIELLGPDFRDDMARERFANHPQYATLPIEKLLQIDRLRRDDSLATRAALAGTMSSSERMALFSKASSSRDEIEKQAATLFTPEEYAHYRTYFSEDALNLQRQLAGADITDAQYEAIFKAVNGPSTENPVKRIDTAVDAIRSQAGADVALLYVTSTDSTFKGAVEIFRSAGLSGDEILRRRSLSRDAFNTPSIAKSQQVYDELTAGLSPEAKAAFDKTSVGRNLINTMTLPKLRPRD